MTKEEALKQLLALHDNHDMEVAHMKADDILLALMPQRSQRHGKTLISGSRENLLTYA